MNIIAWDLATDTAVAPERAPINLEWFYNKETKTKSQYHTPVLPDKSETERQWRDSQLSQTDSILQSDRPNYQDILNYRVALRDYPQQSDFPNGIRPTE